MRKINLPKELQPLEIDASKQMQSMKSGYPEGHSRNNSLQLCEGNKKNA